MSQISKISPIALFLFPIFNQLLANLCTKYANIRGLAMESGNILNQWIEGSMTNKSDNDGDDNFVSYVDMILNSDT